MRVPLRVPLNDSGATASEHIKKKALALHTCMKGFRSDNVTWPQKTTYLTILTICLVFLRCVPSGLDKIVG